MHSELLISANLMVLVSSGDNVYHIVVYHVAFCLDSVLSVIVGFFLSGLSIGFHGFQVSMYVNVYCIRHTAP